MKKAVILIMLIIMPTVYAQLPWSITDLRCGNGILDKFELCDKGNETNLCHELGKNLTIAMECFDQHCTCVPKVNLVYCGNNRRDFFEMCDGTSPEDKCPYLGELMGNISLKCNPKTCGCDILETVSDTYSPNAINQLTNASKTPSNCGDKKVERNEDCDPPNTLCTTSRKQPGICTDKCECVSPELLGVEPTPESSSVNITANLTANITENITETRNITEQPENITEEPKEEKPGFFARLWAWFAGLFS